MSQVFAWISLLVVASTSAYGLQLTAAALALPIAHAAEVTPATSAHTVLIVTVDPVTGNRAEVECDASTSTFASDVVLVNATDFPSVCSGCNGCRARANSVGDR